MIEPQPKDDLEALGYILAYFLKKGELFSNKNSKETSSHLKPSKKSYFFDEKLTLVPEIFLGKDCPIELIDYFTYVRFLTSITPINYAYLESLFNTMLQKQAGPMKYDWVHRMEGEKGLNKLLLLGNKCTGNPLIKPNDAFKIHKDHCILQGEDYVLEPKLLSLSEEGELDEGDRLEIRVNTGGWMKGLEGLKGDKDNKEIDCLREKKRKDANGSDISSLKGIDSDSTC